jgi:DnaJ homolog subfamily B member 4
MPEGFNFGGMPGGGGGRSFHFSTGGAPGGAGGFSFTNPEDIFQEFFRSQAGGGGMGGQEDIFSQFASGGGGGRPGRGARNRSSFGDSRGRDATPEVTTVERPLPLTLEELYNGVNKKMKIKRKQFDETGNRVSTDQILDVPIKPGLKKGSKIKFTGVGDQSMEGGRQDLHFIVEEVSNSN